jgi:transposase InsO family protein
MKELVDGTECPMEGRGWLAQIGARTLFIEPGSLSENGYNESFNGKLRDECLGDLL